MGIKRRFVIDCYIKIEPVEPEIYGDLIAAKRDLRDMELMNPENLYIVRELEDEGYEK